MQSDEEFLVLLTEIRQGNSSALNSLLDAWRSVLRLHARGLLGGRFSARADSSDIVQETMLQAFQDFEQFRGQTKGEWMAWLRTILMARANRLRRFHAAKKRTVTREVEELAQHVTVEAPDAADELSQSERLSQIAAALGDLPTPMYEVVFRRVFLRQPFVDVAAAIGRSPGATRVLWTRAIRKLRDRMQDPTTFDAINPPFRQKGDSIENSALD